MQNKGSLPEEHPGRRPPPSTSSPCPAWLFRLQRPFFRGSKTTVQKRLAPVQLLSLVQLAQKRAPAIQPNALLFPIPQPPPASRRMRIFLRQVLPAGARPQNPQNSFQHTAIVSPRAATLTVLERLGEQRRDFLPLRFGQQRSRPCHRPSLGAADSAYASFSETQPPSFQRIVHSYATASSVSQDLAAGSLRRGPEKRRMRELGVQIFSTRRTLDESQITSFADRIRHGHSVSGNCTEAARAALFKASNPSLEQQGLPVPYSDAVLVGNTMYVAGRTGIDPKSGAIPQDVQQEIRFVLDSFKSA